MRVEGGGVNNFYCESKFKIFFCWGEGGGEVGARVR